MNYVGVVDNFGYGENVDYGENVGYGEEEEPYDDGFYYEEVVRTFGNPEGMYDEGSRVDPYYAYSDENYYYDEYQTDPYFPHSLHPPSLPQPNSDTDPGVPPSEETYYEYDDPYFETYYPDYHYDIDYDQCEFNEPIYQNSLEYALGSNQEGIFNGRSVLNNSPYYSNIPSMGQNASVPIIGENVAIPNIGRNIAYNNLDLGDFDEADENEVQLNDRENQPNEKFV